MNIAIERFSVQRFTPAWVLYSHLARYRFVSEYVAGKVVLDCACGEATGAEMFSASEASVVYAVDISEASLQEAKHLHPNAAINFITGDATNMPLPDKHVDIYVSLETIEHIDRDINYLREAVRLTKPDGLFICSTPNRRITNPGKTLQSRPWNRYHVREYSQKEFIELLSHDWEDIQTFGQNPRHNVFLRWMEFLGRHSPGYIPVHIYQMFKLPRLVFDSPKNYRLVEFHQEDNIEFEDVLAICRKPKSRSLL